MGEPEVNDYTGKLCELLGVRYKGPFGFGTEYLVYCYALSGDACNHPVSKLWHALNRPTYPNKRSEKNTQFLFLGCQLVQKPWVCLEQVDADSCLLLKGLSPEFGLVFVTMGLYDQTLLRECK